MRPGYGMAEVTLMATVCRGVPRHLDAERLVLIQAIKTELLGDMTCDELAAAVKTAVVRGFEIPAPSVVFVNRAGIHLTTSGKVQRASMRDAFLKGALTDVVHEEHPR
jgi:hypothetical protein